ncbi:A disintegrin and metalloproteinase with thrombospondin motifs 13 isoform X1 [Sinocyclocheilus anshuiensis]|uniref:Peptidase M12B domain-containing protein n=1 Tax=Sinocyclocheilus anshuiensis TaxID=1608454 RepID=A0A671MNX0_9TELE|nr:PREDICTED: A disintegrin and metalloproteinase with thrombospondin motifs 13 isoform X1 [Sinocyclocheilus anshuiensis]
MWTNMGALIWLFLAPSLLKTTALLISQCTLQKDFLESLKPQDLFYYFDTISIKSVPHFELVWVNCSRNESFRGLWRCSFHSEEESFELGQHRDEQPVSCPTSLEMVINSTVSVVKKREDMCCEQLKLLRPAHTRTLLPICHGKLQGLIQSGEKRLCIRPVLQKHIDHLKELTVDLPSGVPHLLLTHTLPVRTRLKQPKSQFRLRRTPLGSEVTHLELAVVVGPDVYDVHRQDTERYILTNLNIASELLRDVTLGANIRVHLVRMVILTEPKPDIQISENITSSLKSVCEWGQRVNPDADTDPIHADLLLYITRFDLVLPNGNKLVRGVTQLGGVCSTQWNCVITEDTGFDLGITMAHEIGHSFGINHDGIDNTCSSSGFMMASDGGYNSVDLTWSQCSRAQLHNFFSAGKAECVKDVPVLGGSVQDWRPGLFYGVDDQCRIAFGSSATACSFTNGDMATCRVLSCHINPRDRSSCTRLLVPLLDGTECGPSQWCLKGRCVSPSTLGSSMMVHGSWSSWSEFSPCSRTCGGGITYRRRQCNNPRPAFGGTVCKGQDTEAELCNRQSCESTQLEFMSQQCSATDQQPLSVSPDSSSVYTWIPAVGYSSGDAQCKLMCRSREQDFMVSRGSQFIDGTRCEAAHTAPRGSISACLGGKCQLFGCDGVIHSGKVEDVCGVCGGNGSTCQFISNTYSGGEAGEYVTFLSLPLNASQVHVINTKPVFTHLAVLLNDKYVVSGDGSPGLSITYPSPLEKSPIIYNLYLTPDHLPQTEELTISGPVTDKIHIQVFRKYGQEYGDLTTPNISYQYYSSEAVSAERAAKGRWSTVISACSVTCGTGMQKISQHCVDVLTLERLEDELCSSSPQAPDQLQPCFQTDCPPSWEVGEFGPCSAPCGVGEQGRSVTCVQKQVTVKVELPDSDCALDSKPQTTETCNPQICPARWQVSEPGKCSAVCGPGEAQRTVSCVRSHHGSDSEVDQNLCSEPKPPEHVPCVVDVCPVGWDSQREQIRTDSRVMPRSRMVPVYVWSPVIGQCSKTCGNGSQQVWFSCVDHQSRLEVPEFLCDRSSKPEMYTQPCSPSKCPAMWRYIQGPCSVSCGGGVAKRVLYCSQRVEGADGNRDLVVGESACQSVARPSEVVECNTEACPARWQAGEQGDCSVSCGMGVAVRCVRCVQYEGGVERVVEEDRCDPGIKPPITAPCFTQVCSFHWDVHEWSECSVSCGDGIQSRTVSCMGPSSPLPVSPFLCLHLPKPITIQACYSPDCSSAQTSTPEPNITHMQSEARRGEGTQRTTPAPAVRMMKMRKSFSATAATADVMKSTMSTTTEPPQTSFCGRLLLQDSGTIDLRNVSQTRCIFAIGRPLDEVIQIKIISSTLNCRQKENIALYDRLLLMRLCERMTGKTLKSRSNVLLVRQSRLTPGNGVLLFYQSVKNKKSHHGECDVQLFSPSGLIENPIKSAAAASNTQSCRVFIDAPPAFRIQIRALSVLNNTDTNSTYILIRDVDALKTTIFRGIRLFLWSSSGSRAEVEFHGEYQQIKGMFRAEYSYINPSEEQPV